MVKVTQIKHLLHKDCGWDTKCGTPTKLCFRWSDSFWHHLPPHLCDIWTGPLRLTISAIFRNQQSCIPGVRSWVGKLFYQVLLIIASVTVGLHSPAFAFPLPPLHPARDGTLALDVNHKEWSPPVFNIIYWDTGLELSVCRSHLKAEISKRFHEDSPPQ